MQPPWERCIDSYLRQLTERQQKVFRLLLEAKCNKEIAAQLGISVRTSQFHVSNILHRLGLLTRTELLARIARGAPPCR
jgi:DNA-binding NarL/FixJ family response regulator